VHVWVPSSFFVRVGISLWSLPSLVIPDLLANVHTHAHTHTHTRTHTHAHANSHVCVLAHSVAEVTEQGTGNEVISGMGIKIHSTNCKFSGAGKRCVCIRSGGHAANLQNASHADSCTRSQTHVSRVNLHVHKHTRIHTRAHTNTQHANTRTLHAVDKGAISLQGTVRNGIPFLTKIGTFDVEVALQVSYRLAQLFSVRNAPKLLDFA